MITGNNIPISIAISKLTKTIKWSVVDDFDISTVEWIDDDVVRPSDEEIQEMRQSIADERNSSEYKKLRSEGKIELQPDNNSQLVPKKVEEGYPTIQEQLDLLWHSIDNDEIPGKESRWYKKIQEIKNKYPKP